MRWENAAPEYVDKKWSGNLSHRLVSRSWPMVLQIVLFCAWLNLKYPRSATPLGPLIDKLLAEEKRKPATWTHSEELYRLAFGPDGPPFPR